MYLARRDTFLLLFILFIIPIYLVTHKHVSLSPSAGVLRCCSPGGQLLRWQRTRRGVPERPVGGGVRLSLDGPGCQCDLQAAGPEVGADRPTEPDDGTRLTARSHPPVCVFAAVKSERLCATRSSAPAPASSTTSGWVAVATRTVWGSAGAGRSSPETVAMATRRRWCAPRPKVSVTLAQPGLARSVV